MPLFPTALVLLGWALASWAWMSPDGLPRSGADRWLAARLGGGFLSSEAQRAVDITLSLLIVIAGVAAAAA